MFRDLFVFVNLFICLSYQQNISLPATTTATPTSASTVKVQNNADKIKHQLSAQFILLLNKLASSSTPSTIRPSLTILTENLTKEPNPMMLTITPNLTVFDDQVFDNLTCTASGANLHRLLPYELAWYQQGEGGRSNKIVEVKDAFSVVINQKVVKQYYGSTVYCSIIFKRMTPDIFWQLYSHYISIQKQIKPTISTKTIIASSAGALSLLAIAIAAVLLYKKLRKWNSRQPPATIRPDNPSSTSQDNVYSYIPIQKVSFYEAKALAAANQKMDTKSVKPPPLPYRPAVRKQVHGDEDYEYTYA